MKSKLCNNKILGIICSVFDAYSAVLFLPNKKQECCQITESFSLGDKVILSASILPGKGLVGWISKNNQPLLVPNFDQRQSYLGYYDDKEEASIKAFMGCPIPSGGVLCVDSKRQYSFSDKDHKILQLFSELIAIQFPAKDSKIKLEEVPKYFKQMEKIQNLRFSYKRWPLFLHNFLLILEETTGFSYCAFASVYPDGEGYNIEGESSPLIIDGNDTVGLPINSGIVGWVFRDGQPIFTSGTGTSPTALLFGKLQNVPDFKTIICLPVIINKSTRGVVCLAHTSVVDMNKMLRSFVKQSTEHLALFLENLYLKNKLYNMLPVAKVHGNNKARNNTKK